MFYVCPVCGVEMVEINADVVGCMDCQLAWYDPVQIFVKATGLRARHEDPEAEAEVKIDVCPHCGSDQIYDQWYGLEREEACENCGKTWLPEAEAEAEAE